MGGKPSLAWTVTSETALPGSSHPGGGRRGRASGNHLLKP